jgi:hypothetical protein
MMYFWWNIWKECSRLIFQQEFKEVVDVAYLIKKISIFIKRPQIWEGARDHRPNFFLWFFLA